MIKKVANKNQVLSLKDVTIKDNFWAPRIKINREQTIPYQYKQCKETGRIDALKNDEKNKQEPHPFWDSDISKWIEAASYSLMTHYDKKLDQLLDEVIQLIENAQWKDGYINSYFTAVAPEKRWTDLRDAHELYCAGHLMEAGVAHFKATEKKTLLHIVCKYADYIDTVFGPEEGKHKGYPGHEEIELALVKLFHVTGDERYLLLSKHFIDERGKEPNYFEEEQKQITGYLDHDFKHFANLKEYNQSHKTVREQDEVVGHSVRAMYLYSGMADLAMELSEGSLKEACEKLWNNLYNKKMYITAGIGSEKQYEGFTEAYDLPNKTSYAETCAAIGLVFWNHRMLQLDCDGKYADLIERALYNGVMAGISLDGKKYFYDNPLKSLGDIHRKEWFGVACCPPNISRMLASLGEYIYSQSESSINVHQYIEGSGKFELNGQEVYLTQQSNYPWEGEISFALKMNESSAFTLKLRIPQWTRNAKLTVNGEKINIENHIEKGYVKLDRTWATSNQIELTLPMSVKRVYSNTNLRENLNHVAIKRGPIVYCIESNDNCKSLDQIRLPRWGELNSIYDKKILCGVVKIEGEGKLIVNASDELYSTNPPEEKTIKVVAVPYYIWDNREPGEMKVWIPE